MLDFVKALRIQYWAFHCLLLQFSDKKSCEKKSSPHLIIYSRSSILFWKKQDSKQQCEQPTAHLSILMTVISSVRQAWAWGCKPSFTWGFHAKTLQTPVSSSMCNERAGKEHNLLTDICWDNKTGQQEKPMTCIVRELCQLSTKLI